MQIRRAEVADWASLWPIFQPIVAAGDSYTYARNTSHDDAFNIWMTTPRETYLAENAGHVLGTYYIKTNQMGGGAHVCNCGYMVAPDAQGQGIARAMCAHSQTRAVQLGYRAMQFNFVVETNKPAIHLWHDMGFETVGRLPRAFDHPTQGLVDALVMFKTLS